MNKKVIILISSFIIIFCLTLIYILKNHELPDNNKTSVINSILKEEIDKKVNIKISALGDCTIGSDDNFGYKNSFYEVYDNNDSKYFFSNVVDIINNDDITIANLEGTFTDSKFKREKKFNFKAPKHYVDILKNGSIELVNVANNHTYDYNQSGFEDTLTTLTNASVNYAGYNAYYIYEKDDINIGFAGLACFEDRSCTRLIDEAIGNLKEKNVNIIIMSFHWGIESNYKQSAIQTYLAHYAIDKGVELVLGHHPHVLQGIELYKDKYIVYSLGNFVFGGNQNPRDKDSMIFQIEYEFINNVLNDTNINIYPVSISSQNNINDYKPTLLTDSEYDRVIKKYKKIV